MGKMTMRSAACALLVVTAALGAALPAQAEQQQMQQMQQMQSLVDVMTGYYKLIEQIRAVAADNDSTAVLQMTKLKEYLEQSGQRERVLVVLRELSTKSQSAVVRNAATSMLADALNEQGKKAEAAQVLEHALRIGAAR